TTRSPRLFAKHRKFSCNCLSLLISRLVLPPANDLGTVVPIRRFVGLPGLTSRLFGNHGFCMSIRLGFINSSEAKWFGFGFVGRERIARRREINRVKR